MVVNTGEVLKYLSKQGFGISLNGSGKDFSLAEWALPQENMFVIETGMVDRTVTVRPLYKNLTRFYTWTPNIRQLFSRLEVITGKDGSLAINSPKPIYFDGMPLVSKMEGPLSDDGYSHIHLLRTKFDYA